MEIEHKGTSLTHLIESAFEILGSPSREKLFQYLLQKYEIDIKFVTESDINRIHSGIVDLFGKDAAELLMKQVYSEMYQISEELG
jgi:hypothetical protein